MNKTMTALVLVCTMLCAAFGACAVERTFFEAVLIEEFSPIETRLVVVDDALSFELPIHWEEVPSTYRNAREFRSTDESAPAFLRFAWGNEADVPYETLISTCRELCTVSCQVDKSGFLWHAFGEAQGMYVLHQGDNGRNYCLCLEYEGAQPAPDSAIARDFHVITRSLRRADELTKTLWASQNADAPADDEAATFASPSFAAMLRKAMGLEADAPVRAAALEKVKALFISRGKISLFGLSDFDRGPWEPTALSLEDLKWFPNLERLYVCDMNVTETTALLHCPQLRELELIGCGLTSAAFVQPLTQLETLSLARNDVTSLQPLADLANLTFLNLSYTSVQDLSALASMKQLRELLLSGTNVRTLDGLEGCAALEELKAQDLETASLSLKPLAQLEHLNRVDLVSTPVCDRESISHVENVKLGSWDW